MKFVAISDTHGKHRSLRALPKGDVIIHAGDFCHFGGAAGMHDFFDWYGALDFKHKILIGGNHDFFAERQPEAFRKRLPADVHYLEDEGMNIDGVHIWGTPVLPDLIGFAFAKKRGTAMKKHWDLIPQNTDILITHTPPKGILDKSTANWSLGCEELLQRMSALDVKVHIFGHIHASYGQRKIAGVHYINASNMNSRKGLVNPPVSFDFPPI